MFCAFAVMTSLASNSNFTTSYNFVKTDQNTTKLGKRFFLHKIDKMYIIKNGTKFWPLVPFNK